MANARKLRLIYANKRKTDKVDAENLARLGVWIRNCSIRSSTGAKTPRPMAIIRSREALVSCRTQLVNHVRGAVKSFGGSPVRRPEASTTAPERIPDALWPALGPILEQIGSLTERIRDYDRQLEGISKEPTPKRSSCDRSRG